MSMNPWLPAFNEPTMGLHRVTVYVCNKFSRLLLLAHGTRATWPELLVRTFQKLTEGCRTWVRQYVTRLLHRYVAIVFLARRASVYNFLTANTPFSEETIIYKPSSMFLHHLTSCHEEDDDNLVNPTSKFSTSE